MVTLTIDSDGTSMSFPIELEDIKMYRMLAEDNLLRDYVRDAICEINSFLTTETFFIENENNEILYDDTDNSDDLDD